MAIFGDAREFTRMLEGGARVEADRRRGFEAQRKKAGQDALDLGAALLGLFRSLPEAILAAERAEHERLIVRYGEEHPRARDLKASLDLLEGLAAVGERGGARVERALVALRTPGAAFHGFVSDPAGAPLPGLAVRLIGDLAEDLSARTEADGYFRIGLPDAEPRKERDRGRVGAVGVGPAPGAGEAPQRAASVLILDRRGALVYEDPVPLPVDSGSAYREYQVDVARPLKPGPVDPSGTERGSRRPR